MHALTIACMIERDKAVAVSQNQIAVNWEGDKGVSANVTRKTLAVVRMLR
jgi:hypothetical protein